jgi:hypothetical protein
MGHTQAIFFDPVHYGREAKAQKIKFLCFKRVRDSKVVKTA